MITKAIPIKYGIIYARNALILKKVNLDCYPFTLIVETSLSLANCQPEVLNVPDVWVKFIFTDIDNLSISHLDNYPNQRYLTSSFDLVEQVHHKGKKRIILSTYDHIFDVIGRYRIEY